MNIENLVTALNKSIVTIKSLTEKLDNCDTKIYVPNFTGANPADTLNRLWGKPIGITNKNWPKWKELPQYIEELKKKGTTEVAFNEDDMRLEHAFTVDIRGLDLQNNLSKNIVAFSFFISDADFHDASEVNTSHSEVVLLTEEDIAKGEYPGDIPIRSLDRKQATFFLEPLQVPSTIFTKHSFEEDSVEAQLYNAVWGLSARVGGFPIWFQGTEEERKKKFEKHSKMGPFLMQFDQTFGDINLKDCGVMYIWGKDAFFQCY